MLRYGLERRLTNNYYADDDNDDDNEDNFYDDDYDGDDLVLTSNKILSYDDDNINFINPVSYEKGRNGEYFKYIFVARN